jgi:TonB-linked SusC/RagA family outer membrane protein
MTRILSLFVVFMLTGVLAFSQTRTVTGKVTDADGNAIPFATIKVKGSPNGTSADANGIYSLKAKNSDVLIISGTGYTAADIEVGSQNSIGIALKKGKDALVEVVVNGGYNVKRSLRSSTSNVQIVSATALNTIRSTNINDALAGKVSGIQVRSQAGGKLGQSSNIRLRGEGSLGGGSNIIYVLDGTRIAPEDVNVDEVEDLTVLQGPNAAAIFGPDAAAGAVVMTTKKAKKGAKGLGIELNLGVQFEKVYILPQMQNSYAGGDGGYSGYDMKKYTWQAGQPLEWKALDGKYYPNYSEDVSWGPRMVGQEYIPWYAWYGGHERAYQTTALTPQPNNLRDFYSTGVKVNNGITLTKATDGMSTRITYNNLDIKGTVPNTFLKRNTINTSTTFELSDRLTAGVNLNYYNDITSGDFNDGYSNNTSGSFNQWFHRNLDMNIIRELKDLKTPTGIRASWNHSDPNTYNSTKLKDFYGAYYWYNFYTWQDINTDVTTKNKLFGDISLTYKVSNDFKLKGSYRMVNYFGGNEAKASSDLKESGVKTFSNCAECVGSYQTSSGSTHDQNIEFTGIYNKTINKFTLGATAGIDLHSFSRKVTGGSTVDGFNVPNVYALSNSVGKPVVFDDRYNEKDNAIFLTTQVGFNKFLFADVTLRNDWVSVFSPSNNSILSKSFGLSFVFSDLIKKNPILSNGKIRASWGETPQSLGSRKRTLNATGAYIYPGTLYSGTPNQFNGNNLLFANSGSVDPLIHGAVATQAEIGIDLAFLKNRLGFSVSYYKSVNKGFPVNVPITGTSGVTSRFTNSGEIDKSGVDVQFNARPIESKNFDWNINATWAYLLNDKVVDIDGDVTTDKGRQVVENLWGSGTPYLVHLDGQQWGTMFGNGKARDANGTPKLDANGYFVTDANVNFGNVLPKYTGGFQNSFTIFKSFTVNANIDYQFGGKFFSLSQMWGSYTGILARTAEFNDRGVPVRDDVAAGGGVHVFGVDNITGKPVDYYVGARSYYEHLYTNKVYDDFIYDLTFIKFRELSVGYNIPVQKLGMLKFLTRANFSLVVKNPYLIYATTRDFDPSEISNLSGEAAQYPGTRSVGFNLKLGF